MSRELHALKSFHSALRCHQNVENHYMYISAFPGRSICVETRFQSCSWIGKIATANNTNTYKTLLYMYLLCSTILCISTYLHTSTNTTTLEKTCESIESTVRHISSSSLPSTPFLERPTPCASAPGLAPSGTKMSSCPASPVTVPVHSQACLVNNAAYVICIQMSGPASTKLVFVGNQEHASII